jgi:hypothetical protein
VADVTLALTIKQAATLYDHLDSRFNKGELAEVFEILDERLNDFMDAREYMLAILRTNK